MSPKKFDEILNALEPGQPFHWSYLPFAKRFPPGADDLGAIKKARAVAELNNCVLVHKPEYREVWFVKNRATRA
jgi:hypothetical protein